MSIQKHCVYYRDDENKIYYYDNSNHKKYVNSTFYDKVTEELYYFDENGERHVIDIDVDGYALSADVDTRIENLSSWANETFLTGVDLSDYALSADVDTRLEDTSAWANDTFVTSADLEDDKQYAMTNSGWQKVEIPENTDSWKHQSEEHGCIPEENSIYIGSENISVLSAVGDEDPSGKFGNFINIGSANTAFAGGINIGDENVILSGDTTIANINIGKQNKSKFGILIGQRNESSGFNYLLGDDNKGHYNGSYVIGSYNNMKNDGSFVLGSSNTWVDKRYGDVVVGMRNTIDGSSTVNLFGNDNTGIMGGGSTVVGNGITADDIDSSLVLAQQQRITAKSGSIVIATPHPNWKNGSFTATMTAESEGVILGGYADLNMYEGLPVSSYGLFTRYNGMIVGEGLYASAENNAMVVGNQSYAKNGAWTFGTNGYASDNSMVLNWETMRIPSAMSVRVYDKDNNTFITKTVNPAEVINFSETTGCLFNTFATYGSLSIGVNNSANCGSVIISTIPSDRSYIALSGIKENGITRYFINQAYGNSADGSSIILSTNAKGINYVKGQSIAIGLDGLSADTRSIAIGHHSITADGYSIAIGNVVSARNEGYAIGKNQSAEGSSLAIGVTDYQGTNKAGGHSVAIGTNNAVTSDSVGIGNSNTADGRGFIFGYSNSAINDAFVIGKYNIAKSYTNVFGMSNTASIQDTSIFGNRNSVSQYDSGISPNLTIVGDDNRIYARYYYNSKAKNIDVNIFGDDNQIDANITADVRLYGIMLGDRNKFIISAEKDPGGFNILLGTMNSGIYEAINIGSENNTNGHSVALGWKNATNDSTAAHSMLFGYMNSATNDVSSINSKDIKVTTYIHYTDAELNAAKNAATAAQAIINNYTNQYNVSFYTSAGRSYQTQIKLVDYYINNYSFGFDVVFPLQAGFEYSTWSSAYIGSKYYFISTAHSADVIDWHDQQYLSDRFFDRVRFVTDNTMTNIYNQLLSFWTEEKAAQYEEYLQLSATYTQMVAENNTYVTSPSSIKPETNSFVVGTNNEANHYNSYLFGAYNKSLTYDNTSANDDGFVYAFGLYNNVARNYDMAIGYGSIASGGENISIGTPQNTNKLSSYEEDKLYTKSIGYKNIAVRSIVSGIENIAVNSIVTNSASKLVSATTDNLFLNACISGYDEIHNSIVADVAPGFVYNYYAGESNPISIGKVNHSFIQNTLLSNENGKINDSLIFSNRYSSLSTIVSSEINRSLVGFGYSPITNSQIDTSIFGFNSTADSATNVGASIVVKSKVTDLLAESLIIGSDVGNVAGSVIVTDYPKNASAEGNNIRNTVRSLIIGDNICIGEDINSPNCNSFIIGEKNSAFNDSFNIRIFGRLNSLDSNNTKNYTDIFGEKNVTYTGTYDRVFGADNMFDGNYNEIFGTFNKIMNKDTAISDLTDWSQFQNNTTPSQKARANTTETSAILYTKQSLYNNYVYYYQNADELNTKWQTVKSYIKNFSIMPSTGTIYYDYGILYYPYNSASNIVNGFVTKAEYKSWISYDSEFYIKDYITYEMYNNLPATARSQYSYYGTVSGKSLYYRTIDWKDMARTHVFSAMPVVSGGYATNQEMAYCHFIELETANLTQVASDADLYNLGTPNNNDIIYTNANGYVNAKLGIKGVFNAGDILIADYEEPNVWTKYNQYTRPNTVNHVLIRGSDNRCYNASDVNHAYLFGTSNELLGGRHSYEFIEGCNNRISGSDNSNLTIIGGANSISGGNNYHTMLVGQNNTATSGILSFAFGTDNYTNSACSYAFGEGLRADYNQIVVGKFNEELPNDTYYRFKYKWNYDTQSVEPVPTTGVLFTVGNGYLDNCYEYNDGYNWKIKDLNGNVVGTQILNDTYLKRSNAMIVSADGTVSAKRFISEEPVLEITGSEYINVSADPVTNVTTISVTTDLANMLTELSGVLSVKPATGKYMLGTDDGVLTWIPVTNP